MIDSRDQATGLQLKNQLQSLLLEKGLKLNETKTKFVHTLSRLNNPTLFKHDGINFLGGQSAPILSVMKYLKNTFCPSNKT